MTDRQAIVARLTAAGVPTPEVDARWLVRAFAGDADALEAAVARRERREPLQLILGTVGFRHLELAVEAGVFIPRPETEVLAGEAIARTPEGGVVVDACTGTGAVACAIAQESGARLVVATDSNPRAVALARRNAAAFPQVVVVEGDLLAPVDRELLGAVDVLVANPPYLAEGELADVEPEVRDWDPATALVSGPTGSEVVAELLALATVWLRPGGWVLLEVDPARAGWTADRARREGLEEVAVVADLAGRDRVVVARRPRGG